MNKSSSANIPTFEQMLYQICEEDGISLQFLSHNWIKRLERDGQVHYVVGYKFDLNSQGTSLIADDKFATFEALKFAKVPVINHEILYDFTDQTEHAVGYNSLPYVVEFFQKHGQKIIIKANSGTCGEQVFTVTNLDQLITVLPKVFKQSYSASMCPFYEIKHEYRIILLDNEEKLSYMKTMSKNSLFNLSVGAKAEGIPPEKHDKILNLAKRAAKSIGLRFGSVDIIETTRGDMMILEINSGVMTIHFLEQHPDKLDTVKGMYREAIEKMFEEKDQRYLAKK